MKNGKLIISFKEIFDQEKTKRNNFDQINQQIFYSTNRSVKE